MVYPGARQKANDDWAQVAGVDHQVESTEQSLAPCTLKQCSSVLFGDDSIMSPATPSPMDLHNPFEKDISSVEETKQSDQKDP